jgi:hypothetical protein
MSAARRAAAELVVLYAARERALRAGDATTALALSFTLRSKMERRRLAATAPRPPLRPTS